MLERRVLTAALGLLAPGMAAAQQGPAASLPGPVKPSKAQTTTAGDAAPAKPVATADQPAPTQAEAPIVPDAQFEQALPPLSSDINAPLEPMPQAAVGSAVATPAARPAPAAVTPAQAVPTDPNAPLTPVGAGDPALVQPLVPLAEFNQQPLDATPDVAGKIPAIRYDLVVNGLDAVGLTAKFKSLSALKSGKAANAAQITARAHEDEELAVRLMKAAGYYDGTATSVVEQTGDPARVRAVVNAVPGKLYTLGSVAIDAPGVTPPDLITHNLPLRLGDPIEADRVEGAEANLTLTLPQNGYPFSKVGQRDILLDGAAFTGAYTLPVTTGPRSSFGAITVDALQAPVGTAPMKDKKGKHRQRGLAFDAKHTQVLARFKQGDLYDTRRVDDLRQAMVATGLFRTVVVEPVDTKATAGDGTEIVDLAVHQQAGPPRTLAGSLGYSTGEGITLQGSWTHRNLFPPEGALILTGVAGTQQQGGSVTFRRSNAGQRDRTFQIVGSVDHTHYDAFDAQTVSLGVRMSRDSTPLWQKKFTYSVGAEIDGTNESVYDFALGDRRRGKYLIAALPLQGTFDRSDNLLNPTKGYRLKLNLSPETAVQGSVSPYARTMIEGDVYFPAGKSLVIAGRLRAGSIVGIGRDDLPPSRRYYGGGGGSVRGYGYQQLGPIDPQGNPVGGRSLNEFSLEARYRFGNFGIVPFIDGGQTYASSFPKGSSLQYGAGIGGRFYTNFGPLRVDVATPLNRRPGDPKIALYISIGQAF